MTEPWSVRLSDAAEDDWHKIVDWTHAKFGARQAAVYSSALESAVDALQSGPTTIGVRARTEIDRGLLCLAVRLKRRRARHAVFFRVSERACEIVVVRILHDAMDHLRHFGPPPVAREGDS